MQAPPQRRCGQTACAAGYQPDFRYESTITVLRCTQIAQALKNVGRSISWRRPTGRPAVFAAALKPRSALMLVAAVLCSCPPSGDNLEPLLLMCGPEPRAQRMELHAAGVAAIRGHSQDALQGKHDSFQHAVAPDLLQMRIPAPRAMGAKHQPKGNAVSVEAGLARRAAPRKQAHETQCVLAQVPAARSPAVACLADRTNHRGIPQDSAFSGCQQAQGSRRR